MKGKFRNKYRIESNRMPGWDYAGKGVYYITFVTQNRICNLGKVVVNQDGKAYVQLSDFGQITKSEFLKSFEIRQELYLDEYIIMPNHLHAIIELRNPTDTPKGESVPTNEGKTKQTQDNEIAQTVDDNIVPHDDDVLSFGGDFISHGDDIRDDGDGNGGGDGDDVETHGRASLRATTNNIPATNNKIPATTNNITTNNFFRKPKSISSFVAGFKSVINSKIDDYIDEHNLDIPKYNRNNHFFQPNYYDHIIRNNNEYGRIKFYIQNNPQNWVNDKFNRR
ncbi:MAG: hypothetical protein M0Q90_09200 [Bacteroidales bacterium]|nr:hypothetical protein [Bacteroidales bacterium]